MNSLAEMLMWRTPQQPKTVTPRAMYQQPSLRAQIIQIITKAGCYMTASDIAKQIGSDFHRQAVWRACENLKNAGHLKHCFISPKNEVWGLKGMKAPKSISEQTLSVLPATIEEVAKKMRIDPRQANTRIHNLRLQGLVQRSIRLESNGNIKQGPHHKVVWERKT